MEDDEIEDLSALLDESQLNKCFEIPKVELDETGKGLKEIQKDIGYVPPTLRPELVQELRQAAQKKEAQDFYMVVEQDSIEKIENQTDKWPLQSYRKRIKKIRVYYVRIAATIINHRYFDRISILVIIANTFTLAVEDPLATEPKPWL